MRLVATAVLQKDVHLTLRTGILEFETAEGTKTSSVCVSFVSY
jgi:hypothetical protein